LRFYFVSWARCVVGCQCSEVGVAKSALSERVDFVRFTIGIMRLSWSRTGEEMPSAPLRRGPIDPRHLGSYDCGPLRWDVCLLGCLLFIFCAGDGTWKGDAFGTAEARSNRPSSPRVLRFVDRFAGMSVFLVVCYLYFAPKKEQGKEMPSAPLGSVLMPLNEV
jgi:hypothetical protein